MNIYPKSSLTFSKCLDMKLQDRIDVIAKVGEVAGKEYSIEQVSFLVTLSNHFKRFCSFSSFAL